MEPEGSCETFQELVKQVQEEISWATAFLEVFEVLHAGTTYNPAISSYCEFFKISIESHKRSFFIAI